MEDTKDKDQERQPLEKMDDVGVTLPVGGGLRRSRRVRKLPPLPPPPQSKEVIAAGGRKRKRGRRQEAEGEEEMTHDDEDHVEVRKTVKVSSSAKAGSGVGEGEEAGTSTLHQKQPQPCRVEKGISHQSKQVGAVTVVKLGKASSSVIVSSAAGRSESVAHPCLFIENVLDVIFKHVIHRSGSRKDISQDVRSIRLVCMAWKESATRIYRRDGPTITFKSYDTVSHYYYYYQHPVRTTLEQFMGTMKPSSMIPVQKFIFYGRIFGQKNLKMFRDFLLICGPELVSLILLDINSGAAERIMLNLTNLPELNMLKLRALELRMSEGRQNEVTASGVHGIVSLVQLLLTAAKKLREFGLYYFPRGLPVAYRSGKVIIMQQLGPIIAKGLPRTVKNLRLDMEITEPTFKKLAEVGLGLERLGFNIPSVLGLNTLEFLKSQAATLNHFRLRNSRLQQAGMFVELPRLSELVSLELDNAIISIPPALCFAKTFPVLQQLEIQGMDSEDALQSLLSSVKTAARSVKVLYLPSWRSKSLAPFIKDVALSFPCIVELRIFSRHSSKETLLEVFKYFDKLESLRICFDENFRGVNSLFSGMSEDDYDTISRNQDFGNVNLIELQRLPSLLNLTNLRKLFLEKSTYYSDWIKFSDVSAHFVFLAMPALREIHLSSPASWFCVSRRYRDLLEDRLVAWE